MPRELRAVVPVIMLMVLLAISLDLVNGRFWTSDLRVYVGAADGLVHGTPMYGLAFGESTGFFKYAPLIAIAFLPSTLLPFKVVGVAHLLVEGLALAWTVQRLERLLMRHVFGIHVTPIAGRAWLLLLLTAVLLARELHLGNINLLLLAVAVAATDRTLEKDHISAGVFFGLLWLTKPYLAFMAVPLIAQQQWRIMGIAGMSMLAGLLLPLLVLGPGNGFRAHQEWFTAMQAHGSYLHSPDTFSSMIERILGWSPPHPGLSVAIICTVAVGLFAFLRTRAVVRNVPFPVEVNTALGLFTALAVVPNLVITDEEHFLFSTPLIAISLAGLFKRRSPLQLILFCIAMLLYATRSSDLLGSVLQERTASLGVLGTGNLLLILSAWLTTVHGAKRNDPLPAG